MVKIRIKKNEEDQFIHETTCDTKFDEIYNTRIKVRKLIQESKELAKFGISKPPPKLTGGEKKEPEEETEGEDEEEIEISTSGPSNPDPSGRRTGIPPGADPKKTLEKEIKNCEDLLDPNLSKRKKPLTMELLEEAIKLLRAGIRICYPMDLPEYDEISIILKEGWKCKEFLDPKKCTMWFAGTQLNRGKTVSSIRSVKRNERTTINCKLQKFGLGAPSREPVVDQELQKKLLSYYYKKQEESKKLLENEDDTFLDSQWADPSGMKKSFQNISNISFK